MRSASCFLLLAVTFVLSFSVPAQKRATPSKLFTITGTPKAVAENERSSIASVREAGIEIDHAAFRSAQSDRILLPLLNGKVYEAERLASEGLETRAPDDLTWRGKIAEGKFNGDVVLTYKKGFVSGLIYTKAAVYEIIPKGSTMVLVELDQTLYPPCAGGIKGGDEPFPVSKVPAAGVDSGDRIDVYVLYTASVRTSAGGDTQIQTIAQQSIDSTNTAYINSKIRQRVRLVGAELTALTENGNFSTELSNLRSNAAANTRRDELKADLVDMLTNSTAACGIGNLMGSEGGDPANGFTVTARTCAVGNLSFAHELGHNMASHHNLENAGVALYPYGYGHYVNGSYRTVMSYVNPCTSGCTRVPYFSNPGVVFSGQATGLDNTRDNARSINNTADWVANYRYSGSSITLGNFNGNEIVPRNIHLSMIWTSDNVFGEVKIEISRDGGTTWSALFNPTPNDSQEYFSLGPRVTKRARIRITSLENPAVSDTSFANFSIR